MCKCRGKPGVGRKLTLAYRHFASQKSRMAFGVLGVQPLGGGVADKTEASRTLDGCEGLEARGGCPPLRMLVQHIKNR